ncbi:hypothetical protein AAY473_039920 [Plecturocebus cupreus]
MSSGRLDFPLCRSPLQPQPLEEGRDDTTVAGWECERAQKTLRSWSLRLTPRRTHPVAQACPGNLLFCRVLRGRSHRALACFTKGFRRELLCSQPLPLSLLTAKLIRRPFLFHQENLRPSQKSPGLPRVHLSLCFSP